MLTDANLARMREIQEGALPDTCTIQRATNGVDTIGQPTKTWADLADDVPCRLKQRRVAKIVGGERVFVITGWVLTLPWGTDFTALDRVVIGSRTFSVSGTNADESWATALRAELVEVT